jgi:DNA-binding transcriptional ArsR family regulator
MSRTSHSKSRSNAAPKLDRYTPVFAALGDATRLSLVAKLAKGKSQSISQLTENSKLTRQAVTKHLKVLEGVGFVRSTHIGRKNLFELDTKPFKDIQEYMQFVSAQP